MLGGGLWSYLQINIKNEMQIIHHFILNNLFFSYTSHDSTIAKDAPDTSTINVVQRLTEFV